MRWRVRIGGAVRSTPAVTATPLYVGSGDGVLYGVRAARAHGTGPKLRRVCRRSRRDVNRAVTAADSSGFAFAAFAFGELTMRRYRDGRIEIRLPINETTDVPYYREMANRDGEVVRRLAGEWRCGPLQIKEGDYVDLDLTARGEWRLEPQH